MKRVKDLYQKYGIYINQYRAIPQANDGLRLVERRNLYAAYQVAKETVKSMKVVGTAIVLHPHGDSSIYSSLAKLVNAGLLEGQGNWGCNIGTNQLPPASARYTECKLKNETRELIFKYIDYVPKEIIEWLEEPVYLPTPIPLCFILDNPNIGIGFGLKTSIPKYDINDLRKYLLALLDNKNNIIIKPILKDNIIIEDKSDYESLLTTGKGKVVYQALYSVDKKTRTIEINGVPVNGFEPLNKALDKYFQRKIITFNDLSAKDYTKVVISVIKGKKCNFDQLVKDVEKAITSSISYDILLLNDNNKVQRYSVNELMLYVYNRYKNDILNSLKSQKDKYIELYNDYNKILLIRPFLIEAINNKINDINQVCKFIENKINKQLNENEIKEILNKYKISKLISIQMDIDEYKNKIKDIENDINNIDKYTINVIKSLSLKTF